MRRRPTAGYAMLAVLVVIVLAATFALAIAGAVHAIQSVAGADAGAGRVVRLQTAALTETIGRLRWAPAQTAGDTSGGDAAEGEHWTVDWEPAGGVAGSSCPRLSVEISAAAQSARRTSAATLELRTEDWAVGVSCGQDADVEAPLTLAGTGLYVGGALRGRERVAFVSGDAGVTTDGRPRDGARGADFLVAAAHAGVGIFAGGVEIHDPPGAAYDDDGDRHTGSPVPAAWTMGPTSEFLAAAADHGERPGAAFVDGTLRLDALGTADSAQALTGRCLVLPRADEVCIEGAAPSAAGALLVVIPGDAVVGQPGERVTLRGGLVVCGRLRIRSEFTLAGSLFARALVVDAPTSVSVPGHWSQHPLPGAARPVVVETGP